MNFARSIRSFETNSGPILLYSTAQPAGTMSERHKEQQQQPPSVIMYAPPLQLGEESGAWNNRDTVFHQERWDCGREYSKLQYQPPPNTEKEWGYVDGENPNIEREREHEKIIADLESTLAALIINAKEIALTNKFTVEIAKAVRANHNKIINLIATLSSEISRFETKLKNHTFSARPPSRASELGSRMNPSPQKLLDTKFTVTRKGIFERDNITVTTGDNRILMIDLGKVTITKFFSTLIPLTGCAWALILSKNWVSVKSFLFDPANIDILANHDENANSNFIVAALENLPDEERK
ncbi:hypothetical protein QAD02_014884 [Eretmocerus hayati]|uniref:Uncharacterized protein n=1 Tax=Eretmocerus hayati TaxID=131215 RepID=A0ACC2P6Q5_9HYME|nr:hypothetical protein QAD02_014884 [Eretmocerus hayati]